MSKSSQTKKIDYDDEPVLYCTSCLSLNIKNSGSAPGFEDNIDYCADCGHCGFDSHKFIHIVEWEIMYEKQKGVKFLNK